MLILETQRVMTRCALKTALFEKSNHRLLLQSSILEVEPPSLNDTVDIAALDKVGLPKVWVGKRTGVMHPSTRINESKGMEYLISRAVIEKSPMDMVKPLTGGLMIALFL